jgi:hypothetical protein
MRRGAFFSFKEKELYAKANQTMNLGVWGFDLSLVKWVTLPGVIGCKNTWRDIVLDNRRLRHETRKILSIGYEDCLCGRINGEGVYCLEGFYRLEKSMKVVDLQKVLGQAWGRIHHTTEVQVRSVKKFEDIKWDALHRVFKHSDGIDRFRMRVLHSPGWVRPGWKALRPILMEWAFGLIGTEDYTEDDPFLTREMEQDIRESIWKQVADYTFSWCLGERIMLNMGDKIWYVKGTEIKVEHVERKGRRASVVSQRKIYNDLATIDCKEIIEL